MSTPDEAPVMRTTRLLSPAILGLKWEGGRAKNYQGRSFLPLLKPPLNQREVKQVIFALFEMQVV